MTLDLRQLRYLVAVAEERHVTRAAERLGMAQPPLSQQIRDMERKLGFLLFRRRPRGVEPTEAGEVLVREAQAILARLDAAERAAARTARGEQGRLVIGLAPTAPFHPFVPRTIRTFREAFPQVEVTLEECLSREALDGLRAARLDAAFLRAAVPRDAGFEAHTLFQEPMIAALPAGHPLAAGEAPLPLASLAGETFIAFARITGPGIHDAATEACRRAGFMPRLGQEAPRITSALGLVAAGLGVSLVPDSLRRVRMDGIAYRELTAGQRPAVLLTLATQRGAASPVLRNLVDLVRRAAREEATEG